jgi:hypothetical protein
MHRPFCLPPSPALTPQLPFYARATAAIRKLRWTLPSSPLSSNESDPSWRKPAAASAVTARSRPAAMRASASSSARVAARRFRQQPYARPSRQHGLRLHTPSDDEDEVVVLAKVEEGVKEEKMDTGDVVKKEEQDGAMKKEDAMSK